MVVSASRRMDILACYSDYFLERLQVGNVLIELSKMEKEKVI